jgi:hypothetical protein
MLHAPLSRHFSRIIDCSTTTHRSVRNDCARFRSITEQTSPTGIPRTVLVLHSPGSLLNPQIIAARPTPDFPPPHFELDLCHEDLVLASTSLSPTTLLNPQRDPLRQLWCHEHTTPRRLSNPPVSLMGLLRREEETKLHRALRRKRRGLQRLWPKMLLNSRIMCVPPMAKIEEVGLTPV